MKNSQSRINANPATVQNILNAMQTAITQFNLEVMQRYPDDLLVHDKSMLERLAVPGATLAWMVGHCHTHIVALGFHPKENSNVEYLTNLAKEDRFFVLSIGQTNGFKMDEINRSAFAALSRTPVPYQLEGNAAHFWLYRQSQQIGHVAIAQIGTWQAPKAKATITPVVGISAHARAALGLWSTYAITEIAGTLFVRSEETWAEPIALLKPSDQSRPNGSIGARNNIRRTSCLMT